MDVIVGQAEPAPPADLAGIPAGPVERDVEEISLDEVLRRMSVTEKTPRPLGLATSED